MFDQELDLCRLAFKERHSDAYDRADRLRTKIMAQMLDIRKRILARLGGTKNASTRVERIEQAKAELGASMEARPLRDALELLDAIEKKYGGKRTLDRQGGETPEQLLQAIGASRYSDPVLRLMAQKHLSIEQVICAREIAEVCRYIVKGCKTTYFPVASEQLWVGKHGRREAFLATMSYDERMAWIHACVYLPWSDEVRKDRRTMDMVLGLCVEGRSVDELRKLHRMDWETVMNRIKGALDAYLKLAADFNPERPLKPSRAPQAGAVLPIPALSRL